MIKNELQNIISAIGITEQGNLIQSIACFLRTSKKTSSFFEKEKFTKQEEAVQLIHRVTEQNLWFNDLNKDNFFAEGAEQKVYLSNDGNTVLYLKLTILFFMSFGLIILTICCCIIFSFLPLLTHYLDLF
jgi:hypothetical protein